ncbi:MAG: DUF1640 domain-containing protein [Alphaproteobacteria bacterium]|nr:DUF1640 domain-containing protein [Alphaproteobacteria bacterium]
MAAVVLDTLKRAHKLAALRAELAAFRAELKANMELLRRDFTSRLGGMMVVALGVILAAIRYVPPGHC